jgi:superfamily II DNA/RNA helicase
MNEELSDRIWKSEAFRTEFSELNAAWLRKELAVGPTGRVSDDEVVRCIQAAVILSGNTDPDRQRAAYSIAACANDLLGEELPGLAGALRVVLTRMGNFPAIKTVDSVDSFHRLPTRVALSEETRRGQNEVDAAGITLTLTDFQKQLWDVVTSGQSAAISAPTSAGKSFVLQAYLRNLARRKELFSACYLVPSRALIGEVTDSISRWRKEDGLHELSIINVPLTETTRLPDRTIYILTQERAQAILSTHPNFAPTVVICDEAQSIQDGARGMLLHNVIENLVARYPTTQLIFAGPNIGNLSTFEETFRLEKVAHVRSRAPSVVQNLIVVNTRTGIKGRLALEKFTSDSRHELGHANIGHALPSIKERLVRVAERFGSERPSIVYANTPTDAEGVALGLTDVFSKVEPSDRLKELAEFVKVAVHKEYDLARCLLRRVGYHYGRIPALVRRGVESAFAEGEIRFLVTTSTLIQGVNFPARNLFVCHPKKGRTNEMNAGDFWNLAGRAGRLGKEFQGNIFLVDYDNWPDALANKSSEIKITSYLKSTLDMSPADLEACALEDNPQLETPERADMEAAFARLLSDQMHGRLPETFARYSVPAEWQTRLTSAMEIAQRKITLPLAVIASSPTVSALRQERLAKYLLSEIKGGGIPRLKELLPQHPRDPDSFRALSEIYRICHEHLLTLIVPKLHVRMAAISLKWMRGEPLPEIIDENHRRSGGNLASCIRNTLNDIEQEVRFKYLRLTSCYIAILAHVLRSSGHREYLSGLSSLPSYLEMGASDQTMISFINLGVSRMTARMLTDGLMDKEMGPEAVLTWLRQQDLGSLGLSAIVLADVERALANAAAG